MMSLESPSIAAASSGGRPGACCLALTSVRRETEGVPNRRARDDGNRTGERVRKQGRGLNAIGGEA